MPVGRPISLTPNVATQNFTVTATADQTSFTVTGGYRLNELGVYRNGVRLIQGKDFTATDGSTVTLLSGAVVDDVIEFQIFDSFNIADAISSVGNQSISGELTATAFIGDGSSLTGVGNTEYIDAASLTVAGIATFNGVGNFDAEVTAAGGVDVTGGVKSAGIVTFTNTTASTSTSTGALVVSGGVGIAGSLHVGENVSVGGTLTYEDVTNIDSVGIVTARAGVLVSGGRGIDIAAGGLEVTGVTTIGTGLSLTDDIKARFGAAGDLEIFHDGSNSRIKDTGTGALKLSGNEVAVENAATNQTMATFAEGAAVTLFHNNAYKLNTLSTGVAVVGVVSATTLTGDGSGLTNLPAAGISTSASTSAGIVSTLALSSSQDHKVTVSGISTFTCSGGTEGQSHTLRIVNSGITTVGFSSYFLFPSGSSPTLPTADGSVSLISFTVHRVGTPGIATQLLAGASLNLS